MKAIAVKDFDQFKAGQTIDDQDDAKVRGWIEAGNARADTGTGTTGAMTTSATPPGAVQIERDGVTGQEKMSPAQPRSGEAQRGAEPARTEAQTTATPTPTPSPASGRPEAQRADDGQRTAVGGPKPADEDQK